MPSRRGGCPPLPVTGAAKGPAEGLLSGEHLCVLACTRLASRGISFFPCLCFPSLWGKEPRPAFPVPPAPVAQAGQSAGPLHVLPPLPVPWPSLTLGSCSRPLPGSLWLSGTQRNPSGGSVPVRRGVGAMEIVAMDMKVSGMYIARQLSFSGVTFRIEEIPLSPAFERVYNRAALLVSQATGGRRRWCEHDCVSPRNERSSRCQRLSSKAPQAFFGSQKGGGSWSAHLAPGWRPALCSCGGLLCGQTDGGL